MIHRYIIEATDEVKGFEEAIERLDREWGIEELEPCEDAINRQAVIDGINRYFHDEYYQRTSIQDCRDCLIEDVINELPPVNPQPKTGHWIDRFGGYTCSECGCLSDGHSNYCPSCGAKMK